jgi:hypothetical protein
MAIKIIINTDNQAFVDDFNQLNDVLLQVPVLDHMTKGKPYFLYDKNGNVVGKAIKGNYVVKLDR